MTTPESLFTNIGSSLQIRRSLKQETSTNAVFNPLPKEGRIDLPARFLAGFIPAIGIVESFQENQPQSKNHTLRIFVPINISSFINNTNPEPAIKLMNLGINVTKTFIEKFHPKIKLFIQKDQPITEERIQILTKIANLINPNSESFQRVTRFSQNHTKNNIDPKIYIADHLFGWQDLIHQNCYSNENLGISTTVINCLPPSDKPFLDIRKQVLSTLFQEDPNNSLIHRGHHIDLIIKESRTPHYIIIGNEPTLKQIIDEPLGVQWALNEFDEIIKSEKDSGKINALKQAKDDFSRVINHFESSRQINPVPSFKEFIQDLEFP